MKTSTKVRLGLSLVIGVAAAVASYFHETDESGHAQALIAEGKQATAMVTGASVKSRKKFGMTTSRRAEVDYIFLTEDGAQVSGHDDIDADLLDDMTDPNDDSALKDDASVPVLYMPRDPSNNGIEFNLTAHKEVDLGFVVFVLAIAGIGSFIITGRLMARFAPKQEQPAAA